MKGADRLLEEAGHCAPNELAEHGIYALRIHDQLEQHLYASLPNRHAALHGFTSYGTFKGSLNALIIMQFVLRVVTAVKLIREQAGETELGAKT